MSDRPSRRGGGTGARRLVGLSALVLVTALDVVLVLAASSPAHPDDPPYEVRPLIDPEPTAATASPSPSPQLAAVSRLLVAVDNRLAWRSATVGCASGAASVERTVDGGVTWTSSDLPEVVGVLALDPGSDPETVTVVGAAPGGCAEASLTSFTGGEFWRRDPAVSVDATRIDGADRARLRLPGGRWIETPCATLAGAAAPDAEHAAVLCTDGVLRVTVDAGAAWRIVNGGDAVLTVASTPDGGYLIAERSSDCAGATLEHRDATGEREGMRRCVTAELGDEVALGVAGANVWVWSSAVTVVSDVG